MAATDVYLYGPGYADVDGYWVGINYVDTDPVYVAIGSAVLTYDDAGLVTPYTVEFTDCYWTPLATGAPRMVGETASTGTYLQVAGALGTMQANWVTNTAAFDFESTQVVGPIEGYFTEGASRVRATSVYLWIDYDGDYDSYFDPDETTWTVNQAEGLTVEFLDSNGGTVASYDGWTFINSMASTYAGDCYGFRITHQHPGEGAPTVFGVYAVEATIDPQRATFLRQRQSEVRTPSRVRGVDLRQRQTNRVAR